MVADIAFGMQTLVDIVVTTPGRLVDHINLTTGFSLQHLRFLVIDEADRVIESLQNDWLYHVNKCVQGGGYSIILKFNSSIFILCIFFSLFKELISSIICVLLHYE